MTIASVISVLPFQPVLVRASKNGLVTRLLSGAFWSVCGNALAQVLGLFAGIVTARWLGRAEYGQLGLILSTANLFAVIGGAGLGLTASKHIAEYRKSDPAQAGRIIGISAHTALITGGVAVLLMVSLAPWLSASVLGAPALERPLAVSAGVLFFASINGYQIGVLTGFEAFRTLALATAIRGVAGFPFLLVGAVYFGLEGAVIANVAVAGINCAVHALLLKRQCRTHGIPVVYRPKASEFRLVYRFSLPVLLASLSYTPAVWLSNAALARKSGFAEVGMFNAAMQWQTAVMFFANAVANLGVPMLSSVLPEKNSRLYRRVLGMNFLATSGLAVATAVPIMVASPYIMRAYGSSFASGYMVLIVATIATVISSLNIAVGQAIWSLNAPVAGMVLSLLRGGLLVGSSLALAGYGAVGLASAYVITAVVQTLMQIPYMAYLLRKQARLWSV
jgi:O-antigen/teichoic acid export membrane protein